MVADDYIGKVAFLYLHSYNKLIYMFNAVFQKDFKNIRILSVFVTFCWSYSRI